jgi:elongation factor G
MREKIPRLIEVAIEPKSAADAEGLRSALERLTTESARLETTTDTESGQTILRGTGEDDLEAACVRLDELDIQYNVGAPHVAYLETITRSITIEYTHKRILNPAGEFALVRLAFEPLPDGSGIRFENAAQDSVLPEYAAAVEKGIRAQAESGIKAGFPVIDFKASLVKGAYHEVDSSERAFNIAARAAFRELANQNAVQIVEPFMKIEVATPGDFLGGVIGDLNSRRGDVLQTTGGHLYQLVTALVPLSNMFGYGRTLATMCKNRAHYEMQFDHYAPVPLPDGSDPAFPGAMAMRVA